MKSIHLIYVVVALISPHHAWSPAAALHHLAPSPSRIWSKLRLVSSSLQAANCSAPKRPDNENASDLKARRCAADIMSLVGGAQERRNISPSRAQDLLSCIRFLVPLNTTMATSPHQLVGGDPIEVLYSLVREPPAAVAELARKSVEWAGEPQAILSELDPTLIEVPDFQGSKADKCLLTKFECAQRFAKEEINEYLAVIFQAIVMLAPFAGLDVSLNRYDLFHGHMFTAHDTGRLGILFHSREYPEFDKKGFPINLGYCQTGSFVPYDRNMNLRNIVWLAPMPTCTDHVCSDQWMAPGALFILDAKPDGVIYRELVSEWVDVVRTIYEGDLGRIVLDVNYFDDIYLT